MQQRVNLYDKQWEALSFANESRTTFSWRVLITLFTLDELKNHCVHGGGPHKKQALDPTKLMDVKTLTFVWRPLSTIENMTESLVYIYHCCQCVHIYICIYIFSVSFVSC